MTMLGADSTGTSSCPYRGLAPFEEKHAPYFFGREDEAYLIAANTITMGMVVLHGPSGVGKSSLLGAALPRALKRILPDDPPLVLDVRRWDCGFYRTLLKRAKREGWIAYKRYGAKYRWDRRRNEEPNPPQAPSQMPPLKEEALRQFGDGKVTEEISLERLAEMWARGVGTPVLFIFDQFEQYFVGEDFGTDPEDAPFEADLARIVKRRDLGVHVLISIREDALHELNRLRARIPDVQRHPVKLDYLDQNSARRAIELPLAEWLKHYGQDEGPTSAAPELVDTLIQQVSSRTGDSARIETPYLQLALKRLWEEERRQGSPILRLQTLKALGGAPGIIDSHFQDTMKALPEDEQRLCATIFDRMVTPSGMKIALSADDVANLSDKDPQRVRNVLEELASGPSRIINCVRSPKDNKTLLFEIFHDVLARPILDWKRQIAVRRASRERRKKRLWMLGCAFASLFLAWMIGREWVLQHTRSLADQATFASERGDGRLALLTALQANAMNWLHSVLWLDPEAPTSALARAVYRPIGPILAGHEQRLRDLAYSPNGELIITASRDRTARLWNAENGKPSPNGVLKHPAEVSSVSFDARGEYVITASDDGWVRIWTLAGKELTRWRHDGKSSARAAEFSPAGRIIATAARRGPVRIWSWDGTASEPIPATVGVLGEKDTEWHSISSLAFDSDGDRLVTTAREQRARIWNVHTGKLIHELPFCPGTPAASADDDYVLAAKFSPGGGRVVTGSREGNICIWELAKAADGQLESRRPLTLSGHDDRVTAVEFDEEGKHVVTASADGTVRLWDALSGEMLRVMQGPTRGSGSRGLVALHPGGQRVVASFSETVAHLWSLSTGPEVRRVVELPRKPTAIGLSRDDHRLAIADGSTINVIDVGSGEKIVADFPTELPALSLAFDKGSDRLAVANGKAADIWDLNGRNARRIHRLTEHKSLVLSITYDPLGRRLVTASQDRTARIWDAETGSPGKMLSGHTKAVFAAVFNESGRRVVTGSFDETLRVWDATTGKQIGEPIRIGRPVLALARTHDDSEVVVTTLEEESSPAQSFQTRTAVWDVISGSMVWDGESTVLKIASRLVKTSSDGDLLVKDVLGNTLALLPTPRYAISEMTSGATGERIYTASMDGRVREWRLVPSDPDGLLRYAQEAVKTLPADQRSLTADEQRALGLWPGKTWLNIGMVWLQVMQGARGSPGGVQLAGQ